MLPMIPGTPERRSFDYVRHGTIDLFAALNAATGKVIGRLSAQRRAVDFRDFLDELTTALEDWIKTWNGQRPALQGDQTADQIIDRICRYCSRISGPGH